MISYKIYRSLNYAVILTWIGLYGWCIYIAARENVDSLVPILFLIPVLYIIFNVLHYLFFGIILDGIHTFFGFINPREKIKEIKHDYYKGLISEVNENRVVIYRQYWICRLEMFSISNCGDASDLIQKIKYELDKRHKEVIEYKKRKVVNRNVLDDWDGVISEKEKRNKKLKKLL